MLIALAMRKRQQAVPQVQSAEPGRTARLPRGFEPDRAEAERDHEKVLTAAIDRPMSPSESKRASRTQGPIADGVSRLGKADSHSYRKDNVLPQHFPLHQQRRRQLITEANHKRTPAEPGFGSYFRMFDPVVVGLFIRWPGALSE